MCNLDIDILNKHLKVIDVKINDLVDSKPGTVYFASCDLQSVDPNRCSVSIYWDVQRKFKDVIAKYQSEEVHHNTVHFLTYSSYRAIREVNSWDEWTIEDFVLNIWDLIELCNQGVQ